ncbi:MAG: glycosyltransferase [Planctomycetota bacterium]|jgi:cellulose synthase/poly-beta-1,6-N-acetylglucosamine synthase-like glycosyltransferase
MIQRALLAALLLCSVGATEPAPKPDPDRFRKGYDALLREVVKKDGVDYAALRKKRKALDAYVASLAKAKPGESREARYAFWINAYNALTLQQVLDTRKAGDKKYSVRTSVKDFWTARKWTVAGQEVHLDRIEKGILLKEFKDARVHFAVNCAARSCPPLRAGAWKASTLDHDLTSATYAFLIDKKFNTFDEARQQARLSKIFEWYRSDFERGFKEGVPKLQQFLAKYHPAKKSLAPALLRGRWRIVFVPYDWSLNEAGGAPAGAGGQINWIWLVLYILATGGLLAYGFHAFKMLGWRRRDGAAYRESLAAARRDSPLGNTAFPRVLIQLPVYNEPSVVERAIDAVSAMDWPRDRLEIQVLDDSTDETCATVDRVVAARRAEGVPIHVLRRPHREGFKAGALAAGLGLTDAEYVAIFDADFVPHPDFVRRAIPLFDAREKVACVQGRWAHINRDQNWLTRAQAVGVDAHFHIQQFARAAAGRFLNFNGTAGMWRIAAIDAVGGWVGDTLTEDLDLSYRAQLAGWRIIFDPEIEVPAELPPALAAYKSQQRRWACGSIQCARKYMGRVWGSDLELGVKTEATLHLCGYVVCVAMVMLIAVLPFGLGHWPMFARYPHLWPVWIAIWLAALGPVTLSVQAQRLSGRVRPADIFACFLLGLGSCMNNAIAVLRGLFRPIRTFVRTPKQGSGTARLHAPIPVTEQVMTAFSLACVVYLSTTSPWATATYALFCCAGFVSLASYWWLVERK